jgi:hypothetical protein
VAPSILPRTDAALDLPLVPTHQLFIIPSASRAVFGLLSTLVFATVPVAFSSMIANARYATALWAAYYLVFGWIVSLIGRESRSALSALDLATAIEATALNLFELNLFRGRAGHVSFEAAITSIALHVVVAILIIGYQVRRAHGTGVGGES